MPTAESTGSAPHPSVGASSDDEYTGHFNQEIVMSKGMDQKKNEKKQPTKTLKEKRAAKQEKKNK